MKFSIIDAEQRSDAWRQARLGRLTGSVAADMLASGSAGKESAGRRNLRIRLVLERLTGRSQENGYVSPAMQAGIDREPDACALYEAVTGHMLTKTGFLAAESLMVGCSLDGHVGAFEGIVEIKSPIAATHLDYIKTGAVPGAYMKQIIHGLWVSGAQWCDWLSFHPAFPEPLQAKLIRVPRHEPTIKAYEREAVAFLAEVEQEVELVNKLSLAVA